MKIAIIGHSGAGKSTLAKQLAEHYNCPLLYLDRVNFEENWKERETQAAQALVYEFMQNDSWVMDGNYSKFHQPQRLEEADCIIFMNYSRWVCFYQAVKRYFTFRGKSRESAANGCNEKFDFEFAKWVFYKGRSPRRMAHYRNIVDTYSDKTVVLKNRRQTVTFLRSI